MKKINRRQCLSLSAASLTGLSLVASFPAVGRARVIGAGDEIRIGVIGVQHRGPQLVDAFHRLPGVRVVALCDADSRMTDAARAKFTSAGETVRIYPDFRGLLDDKEIDAVAIATPDHWHAVMAVWACQAGKDVYVEKPVSHGIWEGRQIVRAARKYGRIVQTGTQNRSDTGLRAVRDYLHSGKLGKIRLARGFNNVRRPDMGRVAGPQPVPETVDYDLFIGPAPMRPLMRKIFHYDWHFQWPEGTGDTGNRGVHTLDHIRWLIGQDGLPERIISHGGRFVADDDGETPDTQIALFDYRPVPILWELRGLPRAKGASDMEPFRGRRTGMIIECEQGYVIGGRGGATVFDWDDNQLERFPGDSGQTHQANFIEAMRTRNPADLRAEILQGHRSSTLCHMANISYHIGTRMTPPEIAADRADGDDFAESFDRMVNHLRANEIDLDRTPITAGPELKFDTEKEEFTGPSSRWANMYLKRNYRRPFVLTEDV